MFEKEGRVAWGWREFRQMFLVPLPAWAERSKSNKLLVYKQLCAVVEGIDHLLRHRAGFILGENLEF